MSDLLVIAVAVFAAYVSTGVLFLVAGDRIRTEPLPAGDVAYTILAWPLVGFVVFAGVYAMWATQRELNKNKGEPDE